MKHRGRTLVALLLTPCLVLALLPAAALAAAEGPCTVTYEPNDPEHLYLDELNPVPVSYTHLDVYKRQTVPCWPGRSASSGTQFCNMLAPPSKKSPMPMYPFFQLLCYRKLAYYAKSFALCPLVLCWSCIR